MAGIFQKPFSLSNLFAPPDVQQPLNAPQGGFEYRDPMQNMGEWDRIKYMRETNPEVLGSIAQGLISGDFGAGIGSATRAMGEGRRADMALQSAATKDGSSRAYFKSLGFDDATAEAAMNNPNVAEYLLKTKYKEQFPDDGNGGQGRYSGNVEWGRTKDGRMIPLAYRLTGDGAGRIERADGGDMTEIVDFLTPGQAAESRARGKGAAEAATAIPMAEVDVKNSLRVADEILNDPKLPDMTGLVNSWKPNISEASRTLQSKMDQITGQAFLNAFRSLRGGGQITESEGFKATLAILRGDVTVGEKAYRQAVTDYKGYIQMGLDAQREVSNMNPDDVGGGGGGAYSGGGVKWERGPDGRPRRVGQ